MTINRDVTLDTLRDLIRIDSRNPALDTGAPGERELAEFVDVIWPLGASSAVGFGHEFRRVDRPFPIPTAACGWRPPSCHHQVSAASAG